MAVRWGISPAMQCWPYRKYSLWPTEAVLCLTFIALAILFHFALQMTDTPRQTISILYERNTIDSLIEPCSTEYEFCCKRADVVLCCPNCQQSALLIASSRFQFSEHVSVCNEDSACQCRFVLFLLNKLDTIHTCCIDWQISSIGSHSWLLSSSWWCWSVHLFPVRDTFLRPECTLQTQVPSGPLSTHVVSTWICHSHCFI